MPIETVKNLQKTELEKNAIDVLISKFKLSKPVKCFTETEVFTLNGVDVNTAMNMLLSLDFVNKAKAKAILNQLLEYGVCKSQVVEMHHGTVLFLIPQAGSGLALGGGE